MANRPGRKRLSIDIPEKLYENIVLIASYKNITITRYVARALIRYAMHESKYEQNPFNETDIK